MINDKKDLFYNIDPESVMLAAEMSGYEPTGEFTQLNSYENRVFDLRLESPVDFTKNLPSEIQNSENIFLDPNHVILKFYRPLRWSKEALDEEHSFLNELIKNEIPAVPTLNPVQRINDVYFTVFPKVKGRLPQEFFPQDRKRIGQLLAKLHNVGATKKFAYRPQIASTPYSAWENLELNMGLVSGEVRDRYEEAAVKIIDHLDEKLPTADFIRIHGDCHRGNLLMNSQSQFSILDFDDCLNGPSIQDFWMLFADLDSEEEREDFVTGYSEFRQFPFEQWPLVPLLQGLRIINYASWIARRWNDPFFKKTFNYFNTYNYWVDETEALEKIAWKLVD